MSTKPSINQPSVKQPSATSATVPEIKGWCPGAWHPMVSGDGLVVRVRPPRSRLTPEQALGLCAAATDCGAGLIDLTSRANLQLRGVREDALAELQQRLSELGLLDATPQREARRNLLLAPDWQPSDDTDTIAQALQARLDELPELPAKVGFAIDAGEAPILPGCAGDFRIERGTSGRLLLRADGRDQGMPLHSPEEAVEALIRLTRWFVDSGGAAAGRMRRHPAPLPNWADATEAPRPARTPLHPGGHRLGQVVGLPFGQVEAAVLRQLLQTATSRAIRTTPWRCLLLEGLHDRPALPHQPEQEPPPLLTRADDPLLRVQACAGAPHCDQATVNTRRLAARLAARVEGTLHVSGCAKGCACPRATDICLTGRNGQFDLAFQARASDPPQLSPSSTLLSTTPSTGLTEAEVLQFFGDT